VLLETSTVEREVVSVKLQDLLMNNGIDLTKTKLLRHNISKEEIERNYTLGYLDIYQSMQTLNRFHSIEHIISFLGVEGTKGKYLGCYKINGHVPIEQKKLPPDYFIGVESYNECVFWRMEKTDILSDLIDRLVIDWGKGTINWCQNGTTEKEVLYILPTFSEIDFVSYERILLTFDALKNIINHPRQYSEWERRLSAVAGIYLITDTNTGKHYIGAASGIDGGIWGRWKNYAHTKHGGNKRLVELITADQDYCNNFLFSILEVFPIKRDRREILEYEALYKQKLQTIKFGFNDN